MRRSEFEVTNPDAVESFLDECEYGILSLVTGDGPYGVAVNFAYREGKFYFHGSLNGRKADAIRERAECSFTVVKPYAFIPSYFSDTRSACPATQFFASVIASGHVIRLDETDQKAFALGTLMKKMQPEGRYEPIDPTNPIYTKMLEKTAVYAIEPDLITLKVKAGQNLSEEHRHSVMERLKERDTTVDHATVAMMQNLSPKGR